MSPPLLYRQLQTQLSQWITPKDQRHLTVFSENIAAILQSQSGCLSHWLTYLSHRSCHARSQMERLSYFVHNPRITAETFYIPLLQQFLKAWEGESMTLTLDTSMLWDEYCLIEVCLAWGGTFVSFGSEGDGTWQCHCRFCGLLPSVIYGSDCFASALSRITLLADRGFEHGELIRWLQSCQWSWAIRAKSDLKITLGSGRNRAVSKLLPDSEQASLFRDVTILEDIQCHLATAKVAAAQEAWAVITDTPLSVANLCGLWPTLWGGLNPISRITSLRRLRYLALESEMLKPWGVC